ncbi:MAG: aminopeptidase [Pseudomonadota bacterium]
MLREASPRAVRLKDYRPPDYLIDTVDLRFDLRARGTRVQAMLALRRNPAAAPVESLRLHGEGLNPVWLRLDGRELPAEAYSVDADGLTLRQPPEAFVLESEVEIAPEDNTALEGLYRSGGMFCTQCEAEGFRKITWFLDRPDVMARFRTRIEADRSAYPVLLSNGNPVEQGELPDGRHYAVWDDPFPKPSYLFALVAGDLRYVEDRHRTPSGREVQLRIYVEPENIDKCEHAMASLQKAMRWDEDRYGREYDLEVFNIVAVNDFNMGAMENKGLNIFNAKFVLARADTATDRDYQGIEGVIAHEYFHNWTGNRITCRDWFQLSLKEGFTVFRDQEFSADMGSRGVKRIEDVRLLRAHQFAEDAGPMAHPVRPDSYIEINNFYTVTVYEKGAELVRMQANLLGPEAFRRATDLYFARHDGQAVTTDDFVQCMADAAGRDLGQFKRWYELAGTPQLEVEAEYDAANARYRLHFRQQTPDTPGQQDKPPLHIPVAVGLLDAAGRDLPLRLAGEPETGPAATTRVLELREREQGFEFVGLTERPVPSLLRGFSAPVKLHYDYSDEELMFLMARDSDGFNRWDAGQTLAQRVMLGMIATYRDDAELAVPELLVTAFADALTRDAGDPALLAEVLTLPGESYLGDQMAQVDVDGIHLARQAVKRRVAEALQQQLLDGYERHRTSGPYRPDPADIGRRSLKNLLLGYLMAGDSTVAHDLCRAQYRAGENMTDVMAALALVADGELAERDEILDDFATRWRNDPLVMDKWFSVQAMSSRLDTLQRVQALMTHHAFSIRNPNKVRALIGAFCSGNPVRFHAADGTGYAFLADRVLELDPLNPQVAARLLRTLARWRRFDPARQALMHQQLTRVAAAQVSKDVYEVASKSLAD